jgi:predicted metal-dependent hydrolase
MDQRLRAGVAVYNAGEYHAAHDAWEERWLDLEESTDDERLLHGLIQYTAAVHHATNRNWTGAVGLAESGGAYLAEIPADYRGVDVGRAREYLALLASDPERIERAPAWPLAIDGEAVGLGELSVAGLGIATATVAADYGLDESVPERAAERLAAGTAENESRFRALLEDLVTSAESRGIVHQRLSEHVEREEARDRDVEGLFEER